MEEKNTKSVKDTKTTEPKIKQKLTNTTSKTPVLDYQKTELSQEDKLKRIVIIGVIASLVVGYMGGYAGGKHQSDANLANQKSSTQIIDSESSLIANIAKNVGESVVSINVESQAQAQSFFGTRSYTQSSAGTGFIIDADKGIVMTNRHVIPSGISSVNIVLSDGTKLSNVSVVGRTNDNDTLDVAFLKINDKKGKNLKAVKLADSSKVQVGDKVIAIGNALGQFQNTVTSGIISGYGRSIQAGDESGGNSESLQNLFQTDTAINQGNSGGPLVNVNGEVIGMNTAIAGNAENIGFSIPINDLQGLIKSVIKDGKILRPYLGVRYVILNDDYAYQYNLDVKRGAYIAPTDNGQASIISGSPAEKAGLKEKDIITKANDQAIDEKNSLVSVLGRYSVGDKVTLTVHRDGKDITVPVTLEAAPQN